MLSVPGKGEEKQDCLVGRVKAVYPTALVVHRLDWETSGLVVFALNSESQREVNLQFEKRHIAKEYIAVVKDSVPPSESNDTEGGQIELPMRPDLDNRPLQIIDHETGKSAKTQWKVMKRLKEPQSGVLVTLIPETGRTHQLRVHMQGIGRPILGDTLYADEATKALSDRLMLHAYRITLNQPTSLARLRFTTLQGCWQDALPVNKS